MSEECCRDLDEGEVEVSEVVEIFEVVTDWIVGSFNEWLEGFCYDDVRQFVWWSAGSYG